VLSSRWHSTKRGTIVVSFGNTVGFQISLFSYDRRLFHKLLYSTGQDDDSRVAKRMVRFEFKGTVSPVEGGVGKYWELGVVCGPDAPIRAVGPVASSVLRHHPVQSCAQCTVCTVDRKLSPLSLRYHPNFFLVNRHIVSFRTQRPQVGRGGTMCNQVCNGCAFLRLASVVIIFRGCRMDDGSWLCALRPSTFVGRGFSESLAVVVGDIRPQKINNLNYVMPHQCSSFLKSYSPCATVSKKFRVRTTSHYYRSAITVRKRPLGARSL
jgi:hypothetical protein